MLPGDVGWCFCVEVQIERQANFHLMLFTLIRPLEFLQSEDVTNWFGHVHFLGKEKGEIKTLLFDLFYKKRVFQLLWKIKCISRAKPKLNAVFPTTAVDLMWIKWRGGEQCLWKYWIDSLVFYFIVPGRKQTSVGAQKKKTPLKMQPTGVKDNILSFPSRFTE